MSFVQDKSITRKVIQIWDSDEEFGRQMLNGPHPVRIQKVSRLPECLEPAADDIRKLMDRNITIDKAIDVSMTSRLIRIFGPASREM